MFPEKIIPLKQASDDTISFPKHQNIKSATFPKSTDFKFIFPLSAELVKARTRCEHFSNNSIFKKSTTAIQSTRGSRVFYKIIFKKEITVMLFNERARQGWQ